MKKKKTTFKVWLHMEEVTNGGDTVKGDEYFEPIELGEFKDELEMAQFRDKLELFTELLCER